jgi:ribonuclease VapC
VIVVDTSALFAIAADEFERAAFVDILDADKALMSAVTYVESVMVLTGRSRRLASARVDELLRAFAIEIVPVDRKLATAAVNAFDRYGKGRHQARLNLSDCFAYGLAKSRNLALLFKGEDFLKTDIAPAWRDWRIS